MRCLSFFHLLASSLLLVLAQAAPVMSTCSGDAIPYPVLYGAQFNSLSASLVTNYSTTIPSFDTGTFTNLTGLNFCNVTIQYTHPGQNDSINVQVWLPQAGWNGRFLGSGGSGYQTSLAELFLPYGVSQGYSVVATDGGHTPNPYDPSSWALSSPGNVNWALLQDFASIALDDATTIGKAVTMSFYGAPPKYSYWNGCSTGGRQGLMLAQRYPTQYDGILAAAPAINWASFVPGGSWAQLTMNQLGQ
jgi:Tannase and feruloyl esterase